MKTFALTTIALLLAFSHLFAAEVVFEGSPPVNERAVERLSRRQPVAVDSVKTLLINEGYLDASVNADTNRVVVAAGERYFVAEVIWQTDTAVAESIRLPFTRREVERLMDSRILAYKRDGYLFATAHVESVVRRDATVTLKVRLSPGPQMRLGQTVFTGLIRTRADILDRYIPLDGGDLLTGEKISAAERAAAVIPFIDFVSPVVIRPKPGYTDANIEFRFIEKKQLQFSGGGGYIPDGPTKFVWNVNLNFQNLFGSGRRIRLLSERREQDRQILDITYAQPLFVVGLGEARFNVATRDYRDQFYEFALGTAYNVRIGSDFFSGLSLGWRSVEPSGDIPSYSAFTTGFSVGRDNVDYPLNPSSGLSIGWTIEYSYRRYSDDSLAMQPERAAFNETRNRLSLDWYHRLIGAVVGRVNVNYSGLETNESLPPISELIYIGGPGTVRGYHNEQFVALRSAFGSLEPHLRLNSGYLFVFYDAAYINNRVADPVSIVRTDEIYRYGYGIGAAIIDGPRSVKLSLAWNPDISFDQPRLSVEFLAEI